MKNRAQAAMEFMMTYGWALLVVLIAIGALAFFGVLNPSGFLPNTCTLAPGFSCTDFKVSAVTGYSIVVQNGLGDNINAGFSLKVDDQAGTTCDATISPAGTWADGTKVTFSVGLPAGCTTLTKGSKFKANLELSYTTASGGVSHIKVGQLVAGVEA